MENTSLISRYDFYYGKAASIPQQLDKEEIRLFVRLAKESGLNRRILDMGCAEGRLAVELAQNGHEVTAADIATKYLEQVRRLSEKTGVAVQTLLCDIESGIDAFKGNKFDIIFFMDIIEHLRSPARAIAYLRDLLEDNGSLLVNTPNIAAFSQIYRYIKQGRRKNNFFNPEELGDLHLQGYDYRTLEKLLNFCGFQVVEIYSNTIELPVLYRFGFARPFQKWLSTKFPFLSENLLVKCRKVDPIDVPKQIEYWEKQFPRPRM